MSGWDVQDPTYSEQKLAEHLPESARVRTQTKFYQFLHQYQEEEQAIYDDELRANYQAGAL
jgi:hypothetical protein